MVDYSRTIGRTVHDTIDEQANALEKLEVAVREYLAELDNPTPDYAMRRVYRDRLRQLVKP